MSSVPMLRLSGGRLAYERAIRRSSLPAPARHLALTIATWADMDSGVIPERFQPSISTLAEATGMGASTVKRHLVVLEEEGWIARDRPDIDQARREHARTQYALRIPAALEGHGPERAMPRPTAGHAHGPERARARPRAGHKSPSESQEVPLSPAERVVRAASVVAVEEEREFIAWITDKHQPRGPGWWKTVARNGDLPDLAAAWCADKPRPTAASSLPRDWCGRCADEEPAARTNVRLRLTSAGDLCPACHPDAPAAQAA